MSNHVVDLMKPPEVEDFERAVIHAWPPHQWSCHRVLVAVSGGSDSVALLRALDQLVKNQGSNVGRLAVAHVDHGLRGSESDRDRDFVAGLGKQLELPVYSRKLDPERLQRQPNDGIEARARQARYEVLREFARDFGARYLALGHTRDDQVETVLFRIFRGTGIAGLAGIPATRSIDESLTIVRPLIGLTRQQVLSYLAALEQPFCEDTSNTDPEYASRNWIRHELLPRIGTRFGRPVDRAVTQLASVAAECQEFMVEQADPLLDRALIEFDKDVAVLRCSAFEGQHPFLVHVSLQRLWERQRWPQQSMGLDQWRRLASAVLARPPEGQHATDFPGAIRVSREEWRIRIARPTVEGK